MHSLLSYAPLSAEYGSPYPINTHQILTLLATLTLVAAAPAAVPATEAPANEDIAARGTASLGGNYSTCVSTYGVRCRQVSNNKSFARVSACRSRRNCEGICILVLTRNKYTELTKAMDEIGNGKILRWYEERGKGPIGGGSDSIDDTRTWNG